VRCLVWDPSLANYRLQSHIENLKLFLILVIQISDLFRSVHLLASLSNLLIDVV
jgi:hypothetical protein